MKTTTLAAILISSFTGAAAHAQLLVPWYTIDGGGGTCSGGAFSLTGTIGQPDAGIMSGGAFTFTGGFWAGVAANTCRADFNNDSTVDFFDYLDFVDVFSSNDPSADFNHDEAIDFFDYLDFVDAFSAGC